MKAMKIRMTSTDNGKVYHWSVEKTEGYNVTLGKRPRKMHGWQFTDHEGCVRVIEGAWRDLVAGFRATAANYNLHCNIS